MDGYGKGLLAQPECLEDACMRSYEDLEHYALHTPPWAERMAEPMAQRRRMARRRSLAEERRRQRSLAVQTALYSNGDAVDGSGAVPELITAPSVSVDVIEGIARQAAAPAKPAW